jgi:signal transduction histidine kinase
MSPLQILKLVGFATGAVLHLYIAWLVWKRRLGARQNSQSVRLVNVLNLCLGVWFSGNLFITLHEVLLGRERLTASLRLWDMIAMTGVALLPAALLHAHIAVWASLDNYRVLTPRHVRLIGIALYLPMVVLPYAAYRIATGEYQPYLIDLRILLVPYSVWYMLSMCSSALLDWAIERRLNPQARRERAFFRRLGVLLIINGAVEFVVVAVRGSGPDDPLWVAFIFSSLLPIFFVAYHVYRYKLVDVVIRDTLVYAAFALVFIAVYTYGVRSLDRFLVERFQITPGVIEVILLLGMVALAGPVVRVMDRTVHRLFAREIGLYRDVVRQVSSGAEGFGETAALARYVEDTIRRGLDLSGVRILPLDSIERGSNERRLAERMTEWEMDVLEMDEDPERPGVGVAYALRREGELIGLMLIEAEHQALTSEKRAMLDVLAGQVAVEVEGIRLVEEKVRLERELASRERLATLGQMAAQVAHEVKNPLSAIKSIAQVMREEQALKDYDRDLELIINEIDRLNRTVSQLLAFSRPSRAEARPVALADLISATTTLAGVESAEREVELKVKNVAEIILTGSQAGALSEALGNLALNAVQATERGGKVEIDSRIEIGNAGKNRQPDGGPAKLILTVTDTGPGIPEEARQKIFEPFYSTRSRGTGLGLAIVQRRAVELGASVELVSPVEDGRGTRFIMSVPITQVVEGAT